MRRFLLFLLGALCTLQLCTLWYERNHIEDIIKEKTSLDDKTLNYKKLMINNYVISSIFMCVILMIFIQTPKIMSKCLGRSLLFGFFLCFIIIRATCYYYQIFVVESKFSFNVMGFSAFFEELFKISLTDISIAVICYVILRRRLNNLINLSKIPLFLVDPIDVEDEESILETEDDCFSTNFQNILAIYFVLSVALLFRSIIHDSYEFDFMKTLKFDEAGFPEHVKSLIDINSSFQTSKILFGVSRKTLKANIKTKGIFSPTIIFSVNYFYYLTPKEISTYSPMVSSMINSRDNLKIIMLNEIRISIFVILLFITIRIGFEDFYTDSSFYPQLSLIVSFSIFYIINFFANVFFNSFERSISHNHICMSAIAHQNLGHIFAKIEKINANNYEPTILFKYLYTSDPSLNDNLMSIEYCLKKTQKP